MARVMSFSVACLVVVVVSAQLVSSLPEAELNAILSNDELLKKYVECILEEGPCPPKGADIKTGLVQILNNNCCECSCADITLAAKTFKKLSKEKPQYFDQIMAKYDPTGEKIKAFEKRYNMPVQ